MHWLDICRIVARIHDITVYRLRIVLLYDAVTSVFFSNSTPKKGRFPAKNKWETRKPHWFMWVWQKTGNRGKYRKINGLPAFRKERVRLRTLVIT